MGPTDAASARISRRLAAPPSPAVAASREVKGGEVVGVCLLAVAVGVWVWLRVVEGDAV